MIIDPSAAAAAAKKEKEEEDLFLLSEREEENQPSLARNRFVIEQLGFYLNSTFQEDEDDEDRL